MTKDEAHHLLNKRKQGLAVAQHLVNHALVISGDIGPSCFNGKNSRLEGPSMAQGAGVGELFYPFVARDNPGLNQPNEGTQ
jgi:hypothetical protein